MFVGRERELAALKKELEAPRPALLIVYGRRRVGKSRLIQEAVAGRRSTSKHRAKPPCSTWRVSSETSLRRSSETGISIVLSEL
jgi:hypothetical protein